MRLDRLACGLGAVVLAATCYLADPAAAATSKMGCEVGKQVWDATAGRCVPGKSRYARAPKRAPAASGAPDAKK